MEKKQKDTLNIFEQLASMAKQTKRIGISLIDFEKVEYDNDGIANNLKEITTDSSIAYFDIIPITPLIQEQADQITSGQAVPEIRERHPVKGMGEVEKFIGLNYDDPIYQEKMATLNRKREIFICLSCCEELMQNCPGQSIQEKITAAMQSIPAQIITGIYTAISNIAAVQKDADFFLKKDSTSSQS